MSYPLIAIYANLGLSKSLTRCISAEARLAKSGVEIIYADIHSVNSTGNHKSVGFLVPSSRRSAQTIIEIIGCNYGYVTPYWAHELTKYFMYLLPEWLMERISTASIQDVMDANEEYKAAARARSEDSLNA
jgi:hypothetical protein